jgi:hypothetical protein
MSRSRRKEPYVGHCADSDKQDKRKANRKHRRVIKEALRKEDPETVEFKLLKEVSNEWDFSKDGKLRYDPDDEAWEKYNRK